MFQQSNTLKNEVVFLSLVTVEPLNWMEIPIPIHLRFLHSANFHHCLMNNYKRKLSYSIRFFLVNTGILHRNKRQNDYTIFFLAFRELFKQFSPTFMTSGNTTCDIIHISMDECAVMIAYHSVRSNNHTCKHHWPHF